MASIQFLYKFYNDHKQEIDDYISGNEVKESFQKIDINVDGGDVVDKAMGNMDKNAKKLTGGMIALFISIAVITLGLYIWAIIALVANKKYMDKGAWIASLVLLIIPITGPIVPLIIIYASRKMPPKGSTIAA